MNSNQRLNSSSAFLNSGSKPIHMLNLLRFRERAAYDDGRDAELSGREANMRYAARMIPLVESGGGSLTFSAEIHDAVVGSIEENWDMVAIVTYPSAAKMAEITMSDEFQEIAAHRKAGLEGQLLIRCQAPQAT